MAISDEVLDGFPDDDTGADVFAREYPTAVAPADREYLATKPPLFILCVDGEGDEYDVRVSRVVEALRLPLDKSGKLVPYAVLDAGVGGRLLAAEAGDQLGFGIPRNMTPDRFPQYWLLRNVFQDILARAEGGGPGTGARALRDSAYEKRVGQGGLLAFLWAMGGGDRPPVSGAAYGWLLSLVWLPLTRTFPRWWWARRKTHQLIRPARLAARRGRRWLGAEQNVEKGRENLFRVLDDLSGRSVHRLEQPAGVPSHEQALHDLERLQLRALLEDLSVPPLGGMLPKRRRRTSRPVLLVPIPRDTESTRDKLRQTERFLSALHDANSSAAAPGPLVIAVGRPSAELLARIGNPGESSLRLAGHLLHQRHEQPVLIPLKAEPFGRRGLPIRQVEPRRFRVGWQAANAMVTGCVALVLIGAGYVVLPGVLDFPGSCVGGNGTVAESARTDQVDVQATEWFDAALTAIDEQNQRAEAFARSNRTVRTVVAFVSNRPTSARDTLFDGVIPELRGIALWQTKLNDAANSDESQVPLRVVVRQTGEGFVNAEQKAKELVDEIRKGQSGPAYTHIIGVLGYAQSRESTKAALKVLDKAKILAIGTTATADDMLGETNYWPLTPLNSREAAIEADFAAKSDIVARHSGGGCQPAKRAIVVESYGDLYSRSLAQEFKDRFPGQTQLIDFTQTGEESQEPPAGTPSYRDTAPFVEKICSEIAAEPDSIVYWTGRARDFTAFVTAFDTEGTCTQHDLTVLGGNELTNVSQTGVFNNKQWLRLYYSSHRLPAYDDRASIITRNFVRDYVAFVKRTTEGAEDPWAQDGHSAVAYDAFHVLSKVANMAYGGGQDGSEDNPGLMQRTFTNGTVNFNGATGYVEYEQGTNRPPKDKTLVLLRETGQNPVAVTACGAYDQGQSSAAQGEPCSVAPR